MCLTRSIQVFILDILLLVVYQALLHTLSNKICHHLNPCLYERTVVLVDISKAQTAQGIAIAIQEILSPIELNPSQCVGFSFDGASVMSGPKGGVQAIFKKYYQNAIFVHCHSHRLNLVLQEVSSLCTEVGDCLAMCNKLFVFFSHPKRLSLLKQKQAGYRQISNQLDSQMQVIHVGRHTQCGTKVSLLLETIFAALEDLSEMMHARVEAEGIFHMMRCKKFIFVLFMLSKVLDSCEITTKALQAPSQTIGDASDHVFALKYTLKLFRSEEEHFQSVLALSVQVCTAYEIELYDSCSRRVKRTPQRLVDTHITSTTGQRRRVSCDEDLRLIYYEVIDIIMV